MKNFAFTKCLSSLAILISVGCAKSGSSPGSNPNSFSGVQGNWVQQQVLDASDTSMYTTGCQNLGSPESLPQIDQRLVPGGVYDTVYQIITGPGAALMSGEVNYTIVSANSTTLVEQLTLLSGNFFGVPVGTSATETCTLDSSGNFNCTYNPPLSSGTPNLTNCTINVTSVDPDQKFYGTFTTVAGQTFNSYKIVESYAGTITCGTQNIGAGTGVSTIISSNDVPSEGSADYCGGTPLYLTSTMTGPDGSTVWALSAERKDIH